MAWYLIAYGAACTLPLLAVLAILLYRSASLEQSRLDSHLHQLATRVVQDVERDIDRRTVTLRTLATSPALKSGDLAAFHAQAKAATDGWDVGVFLIDPATLQIQLSTGVPYGQPLPRTADPRTPAAVTRSGRVEVSNLFIGAVSKRPVFDIALPISGANGPLVLVLAQAPDALRPLLDTALVDPTWVVTLWDQAGVVIARSRDHERVVGLQLPPDLLVVHEKSVRTVNLDGEPVVRATSRSALTGWVVAVNAPAAAIDQQLTRSLWIWVATAGLGILTALGVAVAVGRDLALPLAAAAEDARALWRGTPLQRRISHVAEADAFNAAMHRAQEELIDRSAQLQETEAYLRYAAEAAQFGTYTYNRVEDRLQWSSPLKRLLGASDIVEPVTLDTAASFIHPSDRDATQSQMRGILGGASERYQLEFRVIRRDDGRTRWMMDRGHVVKNASGDVLRVIGVLLDITSIKAADDRQRLLIDELNHRVKNSLAIVGSIAQQTLRTTPDPTAFAAAFSARLSALSSAHALLARDAWEGAPLVDIVEAAIAGFQTTPESVTTRGDPVFIPATGTITLSLMLHELATNSAKYGALSVPSGRVDIEWMARLGPQNVEIDLSWRERGGPAVRSPSRTSFGTRLLQASIRQLDGELDLDYEVTGLRVTARFTVPVLPPGAL